MNFFNSIFGIIIGIIMIISWAPTSFFIEVNNKGNKEEQKILKNNINNLKIDGIFTKSTLELSKNEFTLRSAPSNNYYAVKTERTYNKKGEEISSSSKEIINKFKEMSDSNYVYLSLQSTPTKTETENTDINNNKIKTIIEVYVIPTSPTINIVSGLLSSGETETDNKYGMNIYKYEIGTLEEIKTKILNRKVEGNLIERWGGRLLVFLLLFIGLILLISPLESYKDAIEKWMPYQAMFIEMIINLYSSLSFGFALILTIVLTAIMYLLVNYTIYALLGVGIGLAGYFGTNLVKRKKTN